jgi:hypothetical protein
MIGDYIPILYVAAVPKLVFAEFGLGPLSITAFDLVEPITAMSRKIGKLRNRTRQGSNAAVICFPKEEFNNVVANKACKMNTPDEQIKIRSYS